MTDGITDGIKVSEMGSDRPQVQLPPGKWLQIYQSPIGKKLITGVTGLGLAIFALIHMLGNLILFTGAEAYNQYADFLESLGPILYLFEIGLLFFLGLHAMVGVQIFLRRLKARPIPYRQYTSAGSPSVQSLSSRSMIYTGGILALFLGVHLVQFKFGPYYSMQWEGREIRDLARLVFEKFHQPLYAFGYPAVMVLLGLHLRHGFWSAWQSLGTMSPAWKPGIYGLSLVLAVLIAVGFIVLPIAIYGNWLVPQ